MKNLRLVGLIAALLITTVVALGWKSFFRHSVGEVDEIAPSQESLKTLAPVAVGTDDWPWWRGTQLDGTSSAKAVSEWNEGKNIVWKSPVPGSGHASPVVVGERIFLAAADDNRQMLVCFERKTGKQLWSKTIHTGEFMRMHSKNSQASATPACDGKRVYVVFLHGKGLWVTAVDFDGNIAWQKEAGPFVSEHGYGSSPVISDACVIVNGDSNGGGFLAALNRDTGEIAWRKQRPNNGSHGNYSSPILAKTAGRQQVVLHGIGKVSSYDPASGELLWHCDGPSEVAGNTIAFDGNHVLASGGFPEKVVLCIRADGKGDVTNSHVVWRSKKGVAYVPSPLIADGLAYVVQDGGQGMTCFEVASGKILWNERLDGAFTSSPVLADGLLYIANEAGKIHVVKAGRKFEPIAVNTLDEGTLATPAIVGGFIYHRTKHHLYCIGTHP